MLHFFTRIYDIFRSFSRTERNVFIASASTGVVALFLGIGFLFGSVTEVVPISGGEHTEGIVGQPAFVNPVLAASEADKGLVRFFFNNLADLAETVQSSKEGRVWTVRLKENILWHDGKKLTSDDVIFTVEKIQDPDSRSPLFLAWQGVLAQRMSEQEIQFNLGVPYAFFEANLQNLYILPEHIFADVPVANWRISEFNLKPVGSGPYRFLSYDVQPNGFVTAYHLVAHTEYVHGAPLIPTLTIRFFSAKDALIDAFNAGRVDGVGGLVEQDLGAVQRPFEIVRFPVPSYYAVFLNQNQHLALKELAVRNALDAALNKMELVERVFGGNALPAFGPIPAHAPYFEMTFLHTSSSPAAEELLERAGWHKGPDGIRAKQMRDATIALEFTLTVPEVPFLTATAEYLKAAWEAAGARVTLETRPLANLTETAIKNRDYQMLLFGNILNSSLDLFSFWHSSERFYPGMNLALYNNTKADGLIESIRNAGDEETRTEQFKEIQRLIHDEYPAIFLYTPDHLYIARKGLKGVVPRMLGEAADRFLGVAAWHLKTARVLK
ncbi:MAG: peptide ABC transporter substrate-binding protein [Candidatus Liptonbacteria bacterium]|nr:peptide ABC transporter substrate-binding protein [Candidatus Liptonbacteria bacterium]